MIPVLLPALVKHGRLTPTPEERAHLLSVSAATIDRMLVDEKVSAAGGRRRRVGFYSAVRREVPIRTFNDWGDPLRGFCEIDMVAHGGASVAGSFIQTHGGSHGHRLRGALAHETALPKPRRDSFGKCLSVRRCERVRGF